MEKVRLAAKSDIDTIKKLWKEAFSDTDSFIEWNFKNNYSEENTFVLEYDGEIVSLVQIIPHTLVANQKEVSVAYIWGMLTKKEYQGKGFAGKIFDYLIPELSKRGYDLSVLTSAVGNMYEKFGYKRICDAKRYKEPSAYSTVSLENEEEVARFLDRVYRSSVSDKKVYLKRDMAYWKRIVGDIAYESKGEIAVSENGYALLYPDEKGYVTGEVIGDFEKPETIDSMPVMIRELNKEIPKETFNEEDVYVKFPL